MPDRRRIFFIKGFDGTATGINLFIAIATVMTSIVAVWCPLALAQQYTQDLAAAAQNPVAAMYSLPLQNSTFFGVGPNHDQAANVLNIQPVLPFTFGDWNIISRTIAPLISLPSLTTGDLGELTTGASSSNDPFGLCDINQTFYFSPAEAKDFIWGVGPSVSLPTRTTRALGSDTLALGVAGVVLVTPCLG
jgi:hypothetical protein